MGETIDIGIIGDFDPARSSHQPTNNALHHAADYLSAKIDIRWIPTESLLEPGYPEVLGRFAGFWAAPGSPYRSQEGAHRGILGLPAREIGHLWEPEGVFRILW